VFAIGQELLGWLQEYHLANIQMPEDPGMDGVPAGVLQLVAGHDAMSEMHTAQAQRAWAWSQAKKLYPDAETDDILEEARKIERYVVGG
jgi:hypothetical protein